MVQETREDFKGGLLFSGGSAIDWAKARPKIQSRFQEKKCWDLVEVVSPMGTPGNPIVEVMFSQLEPDYTTMVTNQVAEYDVSILTSKIAQEATIDAVLFPQLPGESVANRDNRRALWRSQQKATVEIEYIKAVQQRGKEKTQLELNYNTTHAQWETKKRNHEEKVAAALSVWRESISTTAIALFEESLADRRFRETWNAICTHYSAINGGNVNIMRLEDYVRAQVLDGYDINGLVAIINQMCDELARNGIIRSEADKLQYVLKAIERGNKRDFDSTISVHTALRSTYPVFLAELQMKSSEITMSKFVQGHLNKVSGNGNQRAHSVSANENQHDAEKTNAALVSNKDKKQKKQPKKIQRANTAGSNANVCEKCGKAGHNSSNCRADVKCTYCGRMGHFEEYCRDKKNGRPKNGGIATKVNLTNTFLKKANAK